MMMTTRECFCNTLLFQPADRVPNYDFGPMNPSRQMELWHAEGLPRDTDVGRFFGLDHMEENAWSINFGPIPGVPNQGVISETATEVIRRDGWGAVSSSPKNADMAEGAFRAVRHGIETREDWERLKDQFRADEPLRYPDHWDEDNWAQRVARWKHRTYPLTQWGPSMVGEIKSVMGFENFCIQLHEDPELIEEMMETRTQLALDILGRAFDEVDFDVFHFWEDIAYNNGPILSPAMFERFAVPRYKRLSDFFRNKGGKIVSVDSDGDIRELIPGWLRGGVNHFWPMEANAGMDVVALRREYGHAFSMRGGVNKYALLEGKEAIDRELDRIAPVVQDGGYIPSIDHGIPVGVTFENLCYYHERKKEVLASC